MYNRYIPAADGQYICQKIIEPPREPPKKGTPRHASQEKHSDEDISQKTPPPHKQDDTPRSGAGGVLQRLFGRIEADDLLILLILALLILDCNDDDDSLTVLLAAAAFFILQ